MQESKFADKIDAEKGKLIQLIRSKDVKNRPIYAYISISPQQAKRLAEDIKNNVLVDLEQYAEVIASGFGENPPLLIQKQMEELYHIKHNEA